MERKQILDELVTILGVVDPDLVKRVKIAESTTIREGLGLDSLQLTEMLFEIEERLGAKIEDQEAQQIKTVGDLLTLIEKKGTKG